MKINEFIIKLHEIKDQCGDVEVCIDTGDVNEHYSEELGYMAVNEVRKSSCPWDDGETVTEEEVDIVAISIT